MLLWPNNPYSCRLYYSACVPELNISHTLFHSFCSWLVLNLIKAWSLGPSGQKRGFVLPLSQSACSNEMLWVLTCSEAICHTRGSLGWTKKPPLSFRSQSPAVTVPRLEESICSVMWLVHSPRAHSSWVSPFLQHETRQEGGRDSDMVWLSSRQSEKEWEDISSGFIWKRKLHKFILEKTVFFWLFIFIALVKVAQFWKH